MTRPSHATLLMAALLLLPLGGCANLAGMRDDVVEVEVSYVADIAPGLRHWIAWPTAHRECGARGLEPKLVSMDGAIVRYRCIPPE